MLNKKKVVKKKASARIVKSKRVRESNHELVALRGLERQVRKMVKGYDLCNHDVDGKLGAIDTARRKMKAVSR